MVGIFAIIAAGAAALMADTTPASNEVDPLLGEALPKSVDPADLHSKVRTETRDQQWAPRMEDVIEARLMKIPLIGKAGNALRVTCASTLCEIGGTVVAPASQAEREDQKSEYNQTIKDLQVPPLTDDLRKVGLKSEAGLFTSGKGQPDRSVFLLYYSRADAAGD
jgi:hypothetical protein